MKKMTKKIKRTFEERGWNDSLDLPLYLRRGLSTIFILNKFPGEDRRKPTAIEDCQPEIVRWWLNRDGDIEMARNTLVELIKCYDKLFSYLYDEEKESVNKAIALRGDKPVFTPSSTHREVVEAVVWYCTFITLIADIYGICGGEDTEAQIAYNERKERNKSQEK